ncbi:MAG TPA: M48 family metallopeptidase [Thermoanaerobaculia bacterium]
MTVPAPPASDGPIHVRRWPSEAPLTVLVVIAAILIWAVVVVSIVGIVYALFLAVFFFFAHITFLAHVRGSGVRLTPEQFPEIHRRVEALSDRAGLSRPPEAYLLQAGGLLNALATKFLRSRFLVLYTDLLEACGEDTAARDMIIGHEIGHIRAGHLNAMWLLAPGFFVPFLGAACSRAREYTCDRYGLALCGDPRGSPAGLAILSAGRERGPRVNLESLARQREGLNTGFMTLGKWLAGHPPLCDRVAALEPRLMGNLGGLTRGPVRAAIGVALVLGTLLFSSGYFVARVIPEFRKALTHSRTQAAGAAGPSSRPEIPTTAVDPTHAGRQIDDDFAALAAVAEDFRKTTRRYPADADALYGLWRTSRPNDPEPLDPYTGDDYLYAPQGNQFLLWSVGPDGANGTADDVHFFGGAKVPAPEK